LAPLPWQSHDSGRESNGENQTARMARVQQTSDGHPQDSHLRLH
jgi:hypothetical protein